MINRRKNSLKYSIKAILLVGFLLITFDIFSSGILLEGFYNTLTVHEQHFNNEYLFLDTIPPFKSDSLKKITDTIPGKDSTVTSIDSFTVKMSKDSLDAPVNYEAADSMVFDVPRKKIILYSKGKITYKDMELTADSIGLDQDSSMLVATYRKDSTGKIIGLPSMQQAETNMTADVIKYNIKTQKGYTRNTNTTQQEMFVNGDIFKKINQNEYFGFNGRLTTCNLDTPHFAFRARKMKLVTKKLAVTGPIHPEFEGVPIPIYLPFGFFPLS